MDKVFLVNALWDDDALVWVATSDDVPGLATEAESWDGLMTKLRSLVPELLRANGVAASEPVPIEVLARRFEMVGALGVG